MRSTSQSRSLEVFFSYSHADEELRSELELHLAPVKRDQAVSTWHDRSIRAGERWKGEIDQRLATADIVLLLVSKYFLGSDFCRYEMTRALDRHRSGDAVVIPILLRPCHWQIDLGDLQALPKDNQPVTSWSDRDAAFLEIVLGIERVIADRVSAQRKNRENLTSPVDKAGRGEETTKLYSDGHPENVRIYRVWEPRAISKAFRNARPNESIGILQAWIPHGENEQIRQWARDLGSALASFGPDEKVDLEIALLGSVALAELRAANRADLGPLKERRSEIAMQYVEHSWQELESFALRTGYPEKVRVRTRFYTQVMPSGPIFVFGNRVLFAGYYLMLRTSDRAPMLEIGSESPLRRSFREQLGRIWSLPTNRRRPDWKPPRAVLAPDSFKECLTATEVCRALQQGMESQRQDLDVISVPVADGGEGSIEAMTRAYPDFSGSRMTLSVTHPLGKDHKPRDAGYFLTSDCSLAIVESAEACGLQWIPLEDRNPHVATTRGVGEILLHALDKGVGHVIVAVGGSATVDGGTGLARALGFRFLDESGNDLPEGGLALQKLAKIVEPPPSDRKRWESVRIEVACDVDNPLVGRDGAARVYAAQKGMPGRVDVAALEKGLNRLARVILDQYQVDLRKAPYCGAAGGLAAGLSVFAGAQLRAGFDLISSRIGLREKLDSADLVVTGEGRTDHQTLRKKVCHGVSALARELDVRCVLVSGAIGDGFDAEELLGVDRATSLMKQGETAEESMASAAERLQEAGRAIAVPSSSAKSAKVST